MVKKILLIFIPLIIFILIAVGIKLNNPLLNNLDQKIGNLLLIKKEGSFIYSLSLFFTKILEPINATIIIVIFSLVSIIKKKKYDAYLLLISSGLAISLSSAIKIIFNRTRPITHLITEDTLSFPSNHAVISAILICFCVYLITKYLNNKLIKLLLISLFGLLFVFIPLTRIMLGVHFTSDVVAGFSLGIFIYFFTGMILNTLTEGKADCGVCLKEKNVL